MPDLLLQDFSIDFERLRNQKLTILNIIDQNDNVVIVEDLEGIVNFINYIQDQAEQSGIWSEPEIFGDATE